jgi:hypothetical protein
VKISELLYDARLQAFYVSPVCNIHTHKHTHSHTHIHLMLNFLSQMIPCQSQQITFTVLVHSDSRFESGWGMAIFSCLNAIRYMQGYSKRRIHFQKCILQELLNIWRRAIYIYWRENSQVMFIPYNHSICEPHVWRGRWQTGNPALPTLHITPLGRQNYCVRTWHLAPGGDSNQNFERFPFHPYTGHGFSVSSFCKINFWKCILLFE